MLYICNIHYYDGKEEKIDDIFIEDINNNKAEILITSQLKKDKAIIMLNKSYNYPKVDNVYDIINTLMKTKYNTELISKLNYEIDNLKIVALKKLIILKSQLKHFSF